MAWREVSTPVAGAGSGVFFGLFMGIYAGVDSGVLTGVIAGVLTGAAFGLLMGIWLARQRRRAVAALGSVTPKAAPAVLRRAAKDPASADPEVRAEALRINEFQLAELGRTKRRSLLIFSVAIVLELVMALTTSPWFWLAAAFFAGMLIVALVSGTRLRRTVERLRG